MTKIEEKKEIKPNKKQQECIDNITGKWLVLAGPGTGKTFTVINRIKNMLEKGIEPEKILCLTFTDAAVNEIKKRVEEKLGASALDINVFTYHGFCCNIIEQFPEEFELPANYNVITDVISRAFIKDCIDEYQPKHLRTKHNDPYYYIQTIKNGISTIKQYRMDKAKFESNLKNNPEWIPSLENLTQKYEEDLKKKGTANPEKKDKVEKRINKAREIWDIYELYQDKLVKNKYLDFNDMINLVLNKFDESPSFLKEIANNYEHLLVDEYQDTNNSQNDIIFNLTKALDTQNVFVVGDDDQIIYRFQGAKLDTVQRFLREFPDTNVVCLEENMRSTQTILDTAYAVAIQDDLRLENDKEFKRFDISKKLTAKNEELYGKNKPVRCIRFHDDEQEKLSITDEIEELINSEECPKDKDGNKSFSQIAIIVRSNDDAKNYADMLKLKNIPFELKDGQNIFEITSVYMLYLYILVLVDPEMYSGKFFNLLLTPPFNFNPKDYQSLYKRLPFNETFVDAMRTLSKEKLVESDKIEKFLETYDYLKRFKSKENVKNTILEIGAKTGIFGWYLNEDINRTENIAGLLKFLDEATGFSKIHKGVFIDEFIKYIRDIINDEEQIKTDKSPVALNAVQILTYHSAKGREFEYVYMPLMNNGKWESSNKSNKTDVPLDPKEYKDDEALKAEKYSDAIKLIYVGMTRAKHTLRISYPLTINGKVKKPTKFISSIENMMDNVEQSEYETEENYWENRMKLLKKNEFNYLQDFKDFISAKLNDVEYSASSINTYLKCPRQYLYGNILELDTKDSNENVLSYGKAIHKVCEKVIEFAIKNHFYPEKEEVLKWFKNSIDSFPMENLEQRKIFSERGEKALDKYYAIILNTPIGSLYSVEQEIKSELDGIKFKGYIDRIDKNDDGSFSIYDYKTGSAKTGIKVGGTHEDYYNQMCLYKYFYEKETGKKVSVTKFVYPEDIGKDTELTFTDDECLAVVEKFKQAVSDINNYKYEPSYDSSACQYCAYKDICDNAII